MLTRQYVDTIRYNKGNYHKYIKNHNIANNFSDIIDFDIKDTYFGHVSSVYAFSFLDHKIVLLGDNHDLSHGKDKDRMCIFPKECKECKEKNAIQWVDEVIAKHEKTASSKKLDIFIEANEPNELTFSYDMYNIFHSEHPFVSAISYKFYNQMMEQKWFRMKNVRFHYGDIRDKIVIADHRIHCDNITVNAFVVISGAIINLLRTSGDVKEITKSPHINFFVEQKEELLKFYINVWYNFILLLKKEDKIDKIWGLNEMTKIVNVYWDKFTISKNDSVRLATIEFLYKLYKEIQSVYDKDIRRKIINYYWSNKTMINKLTVIKNSIPLIKTFDPVFYTNLYIFFQDWNAIYLDLYTTCRMFHKNLWKDNDMSIVVAGDDHVTNIVKFITSSFRGTRFFRKDSTVKPCTELINGGTFPLIDMNKYESDKNTQELVNKIGFSKENVINYENLYMVSNVFAGRMIFKNSVEVDSIAMQYIGDDENKYYLSFIKPFENNEQIKKWISDNVESLQIILDSSCLIQIQGEVFKIGDFIIS